MPTFLSTLSLRRATVIGQRIGIRVDISIHALLAESDLITLPAFLGFSNFYPRSPCGERHRAINIQRPTTKFLSTLSLRRATRGAANCYLDNIDFYPRSPCGERPWARGSRVTYVEFLSTLSLRRATSCKGIIVNTSHYFYPRSPCGERPISRLIVS